MRIILSVFALAGFINVVNAQNFSGEWLGTLQAEATEAMYPIKLELVQNGNVISGRLKNYTSDGFEAVTSITGNFENEKLTFGEQEILSISDSSLLGDMCMLRFEMDSMMQRSKKLIVFGRFEGKFADGKVCDRGTFMMSNIKIPRAITKRLEKKLGNFDLDGGKLNTDTLLSKNEVTPLMIGGNSVTLALWDGGQVDGDSIMVYSSENTTKKQVINLTSDPEKVSFKLTKAGDVKVFIAALNIGATPPNTSQVHVLDEKGERLYTFTTNLSKGDTTVLYFKKP